MGKLVYDADATGPKHNPAFRVAPAVYYVFVLLIKLSSDKQL